LRAGIAKAKLRVGSPRDPDEAEADRSADAFVRAKSKVERPRSSCECGGICDQCVRKADHGIVKRSPTSSWTGSDIELDAHREAVVRDLGPGRPLDSRVRTPFESHLGTDLSSVLIHDGPSANRAAESIGAQAFTLGNAIAFNFGQFSAQSHQGQQL